MFVTLKEPRFSNLSEDNRLKLTDMMLKYK